MEEEEEEEEEEKEEKEQRRNISSVYKYSYLHNDSDKVTS